MKSSTGRMSSGAQHATLILRTIILQLTGPDTRVFAAAKKEARRCNARMLIMSPIVLRKLIEVIRPNRSPYALHIDTNEICSQALSNHILGYKLTVVNRLISPWAPQQLTQTSAPSAMMTCPISRPSSPYLPVLQYLILPVMSLMTP